MKTTSTRIKLKDEAALRVTEMVTLLGKNHSYIKINPSQLVSWVVTWFAQHGLVKAERQLADDHFDSKAYLKATIKAIGSGDTDEESIRMSLAKIASRKN